MALDPTATVGSTPVLTFQDPRESEMNSVIEIIHSHTLMEKVVDAIGPAVILGRDDANSNSVEDLAAPSSSSTAKERDAAIRRLSRTLDAEAVKKSNVVEITCDAASPELAQSLVDKTIELYLIEHVRLNRTPGAEAFLSEQTSKSRDLLQDKEEELRKVKGETGMIEPQAQRTIVVNRIGRLKDESLQIDAELASAEAEMKRLQEQLASLPETQVTEETVGLPNEAADQMRNQLYTLQMKEQDLATKFTDDHPQLQQVRQQIADAQVVLDKEQPAHTQTKTGVSKPHEEVKLQILREEPVLAALRAKSAQINSQLSAEKAASDQLNSDEIQVARLERDAQLAEANYRKYSDSLEQARIDGAMAQQGKSNISIVQPATLDMQPVKPRVLFNLALAIVIGGLGGLGLAFFAESWHESADSNNADRHLEIPTVTATRRVEVSSIR